MEPHLPPAPSTLGSGFPAEPVIDHIMTRAGVQRVPSASVASSMTMRP